MWLTRLKIYNHSSRIHRFESHGVMGIQESPIECPRRVWISFPVPCGQWLSHSSHGPSPPCVLLTREWTLNPPAPPPGTAPAPGGLWGGGCVFVCLRWGHHSNHSTDQTVLQSGGVISRHVLVIATRRFYDSEAPNVSRVNGSWIF